jgi:HSP20 family protein
MTMREKASVPVRTEETRVRRFDPFETFDALQDEMTRFWSQLWPVGPFAMRRPFGRTLPAPTTWAPRLDVFERDNKLVVKAELPGVKKEDLDVALDQGDLVIRGERKAEHEVKEEQYYRMERSYGSFYRRLPLPFEIKPEQIEAKFADGVLEITIPKPPEAKTQPTKIAVT